MEGIVTTNNKALSGIDLSAYELIANKTTNIKNSSTDTEYPTAKSVYNFASPKSSMATSAEFNTYKDSDIFFPSCKAVNDKLTAINDRVLEEIHFLFDAYWNEEASGVYSYETVYYNKAEHHKIYTCLYYADKISLNINGNITELNYKVVNAYDGRYAIISNFEYNGEVYYSDLVDYMATLPIGSFAFCSGTFGEYCTLYVRANTEPTEEYSAIAQLSFALPEGIASDMVYYGGGYTYETKNFYTDDTSILPNTSASMYSEVVWYYE